MVICWTLIKLCYLIFHQIKCWSGFGRNRRLSKEFWRANIFPSCNFITNSEQNLWDYWKRSDLALKLRIRHSSYSHWQNSIILINTVETITGGKIEVGGYKQYMKRLSLLMSFKQTKFTRVHWLDNKIVDLITNIGVNDARKLGEIKVVILPHRFPWSWWMS